MNKPSNTHVNPSSDITIEINGCKALIVTATGRTDLRRGIDGLATLVRLNYGMNPLNFTLLFVIRFSSIPHFK